MEKRELASRIKCELDVNDPTWARDFHDISELMDTLREKGFTGEQAHLLGAAPSLLAEASRIFETELKQEDEAGRAPYMTVAAMEALIAQTKTLLTAYRSGDLGVEAILLQRVEQNLQTRLIALKEQEGRLNTK